MKVLRTRTVMTWRIYCLSASEEGKSKDAIIMFNKLSFWWTEGQMIRNRSEIKSSFLSLLWLIACEENQEFRLKLKVTLDLSRYVPLSTVKY